MQAHVIKALLTVNPCFEVINSEEFSVADDIPNAPSYIQRNPSGAKHFIVKNYNLRDISFLAIDACVLNSLEIRKCDFVVFTEDNFCFVEIKKSTNRALLKDAIEQLESTIKIFSSCINFNGVNVEAFACFRNMHPKPEAQVTLQSEAIRFYDQYKIRLKDRNFKNFI